MDYSNGARGSNKLITKRQDVLEKQLIPDAETISLKHLPDHQAANRRSLNKSKNSLCEANKPYRSSNKANALKESPSLFPVVLMPI